MESPGFWLLPGVRTPFCRVDGALAERDGIELSVPVVRAMNDHLDDDPDALVWGEVAATLQYSNIARELWLDADLNPDVPALSTAMACSTSMAAVFDAVGLLERGDREVALCGGVESMSNVQVGLKQGLSNWLRRLTQSRGVGDAAANLADLSFGDVGLFIPSVENRSTGMSMGEHCEEMAVEWEVSRRRQDEIALASHENAVAGREEGFFEDLIVEVDDTARDAFPRSDTSMEALGKLSAAFAEEGTITAGNASPLTDGAAGVWLSTESGLERFRDDRPRVRLLDWEVAAVDIFEEGLLMAPAYAIPRLLERHDLRYEDVELWEIHEAFAAQVACHIRALESESFLEDRVNVRARFGDFPAERVNPNGGSVALGHPFAATGARILSQAVRELAGREPGTKGIVSICANGGLGTVGLLESA